MSVRQLLLCINFFCEDGTSTSFAFTIITPQFRMLICGLSVKIFNFTCQNLLQVEVVISLLGQIQEGNHIVSLVVCLKFSKSLAGDKE
jgi:hypothetical protein